LAGAIIEKVSSQSYFDYARENIFKPAGMTATDSYEMDHPVPNLAIGYSPAQNDDGARWTNNIFMHVVKGGPAGGGFSTVEDLLRFDQALRNHKLLSAEMTETVWSAKPELNSPGYGYGFGVERPAPDRIVGHSGGFPGISAKLSMYLDRGYSVVVLSNTDSGAPLIADKIRELLDRVED
jgi:CubicO group peptidase (beta-lactamase class C family)